MAAIIGTNIKVEVQSTLGSAKTASAITKANPGVVTSTAHGFVDGDIVVASMPGGMVELDGYAVRVADSTTDTFALEGVDTTNFSTFTAGTFEKVTALQTLASAQSITMPNPTPTKIDVTTLIDKVKRSVYALPDAPDGSISGLFNPGGVAEALIIAATDANLPLAFRITFAGGQKTVFNANVSGGQGFSLAPNQAATATIAFTPINVLHYAS